MPQILLETSSNLTHPPSYRQVFAELHGALAALETFAIADIKSRWVEQPHTYIGDGSPQQSFIYLHVALLSGRDQSVRTRLARACMQVLEAQYPAHVRGASCQMSVEVREMERSTYVKCPPESAP